MVHGRSPAAYKTLLDPSVVVSQGPQPKSAAAVVTAGQSAAAENRYKMAADVSEQMEQSLERTLGKVCYTLNQC